MLATASLQRIKTMDISEYQYKYFIVINPKKVKLNGFQHRPDLAPSKELYSWTMQNNINSEWFSTYKEKFLDEMETRAGLKNAVNEVIEKARKCNVLLVCFCPDVNLCHRGLIADKAKDAGIEVIRN